MKYLIKRTGQYLHSYAVIPDYATHEFKQETYLGNFGTTDYIEIDESEMHSFGVLKSEFEEFKLSEEYNEDDIDQSSFDDQIRHVQEI